MGRADGIKGIAPIESPTPTTSTTEEKMKTVLISAGHSNTDSGAVHHGLYEQVLVTELRNLVAGYLKEQGVSVITDGANNENKPLNTAIKKARQADIAVELHFNAFTNSAARGIEVLASHEDREFAQSLASAIHSVTGSPLRGDDGYKPEDSGQHKRLGFVQAGGLIVEVEFMSNQMAMSAYLSNKDEVAKALADVIKAEVENE